MSGSRPLLVEKRFAAATYDIDFARIVHNSVYIRWLEDLRLLLLAKHTPFEGMLADGLSPILTRTEVDYLLPVHFGDDVHGRMWLKNLTRVRWIVEAEFRVGNVRHAAALQQGFVADLETLRPVRIPRKLQEHWTDAKDS